MMIPNLESCKAWLLWEHDPCPEGGWSIHSQYDTKEEAEAAGKLLDIEKERQFLQMVAFCEKQVNHEPWVRSNECYDGCMVTPRPVFMIRVEIPPDEKKQ